MNLLGLLDRTMAGLLLSLYQCESSMLLCIPPRPNFTFLISHLMLLSFFLLLGQKLVHQQSKS